MAAIAQARTDRVMQALLKMRKLDLVQLREAYEKG